MHCLGSIHHYYNHRHNYPILVHYFDDIYDGVQVGIPNVKFIQVPYATPRHIKKEELFYNRDNNYARTRFSKDRKGFLHMNHFLCNMYTYPNAGLDKFDYIFVFDDDCGIVKELPFDPIDKLANLDEDMAAITVGQRLKNGKPPPNHIDCREGLWEFTKKFLHKYHKYPKCQLLRDLLKDPKAEYNMNYLPWSDGSVIKTKMFKSAAWKRWIHEVNCNGGIYKHRWGDIEVLGLFYMIHNPNPIYNLNLVEDGYIDQGHFRGSTAFAPGVKNNDR